MSYLERAFDEVLNHYKRRGQLHTQTLLQAVKQSIKSRSDVDNYVAFADKFKASQDKKRQKSKQKHTSKGLATLQKMEGKYIE